MYREEELTAIRAQQKKRWLLVVIPEILLAIAITAILVIRSTRALDDTTAQIMVDVCSILMAVILIAGWSLFIKPLHSYEKMLHGVLHGINHVIDDCTFNHFDEEISEVEGVRYWSMTVNRIDDKQKPYEQLFYFDMEKQRPVFTEGQPLRVTYHDRTIRLVEAI